MKIKKVFISFFYFSFLFLQNPLFSEETSPVRNKPLAILLSVVCPGTGQIYSGQLVKGIVIWSSSTILAYGFFSSFCDIDLSTIWTSPPRFRLRTDIDKNSLFWSIGLGITYSLLYIYNIVDAAFDQNTSIGFDINKDTVSLCYQYQF